MKKEIEIICPKCEHVFNLDEYVRKDVEKGLQADMNKALAEREESLKIEFNSKEKNLRNELNQKFIDEVAKKQSIIQGKVEKEYQDKLELQKSTIQTLTEKMTINQLEVEKQKRELREAKEKAELDFEIKLQQKVQQNQEIIDKTLTNKEMQISELSKQINDLVKLNGEMERKIKQGSMQAQGEIQEVILEKFLNERYINDIISPVPKGMTGADVIQTVRTPYGKVVGTIVFESKRTKSFDRGWIEKLQNDAMQVKADILIIATQAMPKDGDKLEVINGVYVVRFDYLQFLVTMLREGLIMVFEAKESSNGKDEKMNALYNYLTGLEFKQTFEQILQSYILRKVNIDKGRKQMEKFFDQEEKLLEKAVTNTNIFCDSIKNITGGKILIDKQEAPALVESTTDNIF